MNFHRVFWLLCSLLLSSEAIAQVEGPTRQQILDSVTNRNPEVRVEAVDTETLRVRRIDVVDSNGVIRMTLAGDMPNPVIDGVEYSRSTPVSGIMMRDDQGNERGGWGWATTPKAMVLALDHPMGEGAGMNVLRSGTSNFMLLSRPPEETDPSLGDARLPTGRQYAGVHLSMSADGTPRISVKDKEDRPRLRMTVTPEGYGAIEFLDAEGNVIETFAPERDRQ